MFTFGIIPTSGVPSASTTVAAWSPLRIQGETQAEACQGCVFAIEEAEDMFGRWKRQPDARPNTAATSGGSPEGDLTPSPQGTVIDAPNRVGSTLLSISGMPTPPSPPTPPSCPMSTPASARCPLSTTGSF